MQRRVQPLRYLTALLLSGVAAVALLLGPQLVTAAPDSAPAGQAGPPRAVSAAGPCPCTLWSPNTIPTTASFPDPHGVELGVKFRADVAGYLTGIRFYKGPWNTGTHVGSLWLTNGTLLATAIFANETAEGWQTVSFAAPVLIAANTTYVASYHTNAGNYAVDRPYFAPHGWDAPPLHALPHGWDGGNGVYVYSPVPAFPALAYEATNYWVDVVFVPAPPPPATSPPLPTATATPTRTPTPSPTPYPRPNVVVQAVPGATAGRLQSTLRARDAGCMPNNQLLALRFIQLTNASVDIPGVGTITAPTTAPIALPGQPAAVTLTVNRLVSGQAATVEFIVTDGCGQWPTFVGGGPGAF
jgi:hypothetical protein